MIDKLLKISKQQLVVLEHLCADGAGDKDIAKRMGISRQTVKYHMSEAKKRLGATNGRTHLAVLALRHGLVSL